MKTKGVIKSTEVEDLDTQTQYTLEDMESVCRTEDGKVTDCELSEDVTLINPDEDSMESRG